MCPSDDSGNVNNPKLLAIQAVKEQATTSQGRLGGLVSSAETTSDQIDEGLTEAVWTSPVADDYRTKISEKVSASDTVMQNIISALADAENTIIDSGMEMVPRDSAEARWPNS